MPLGTDLPGARPGEAAVLLSLLPASALLAVQAAACPRGPQSSARGPCIPGTQGTNAPSCLRLLMATCEEKVNSISMIQNGWGMIMLQSIDFLVLHSDLMGGVYCFYWPYS
jgi:hypothetical protein